MPPTPTRRLDPESRADLVAYLDDELADGRRAEIDSLLETNAVARGELESLRKTWDLLDELPRATTQPDFTAATLAAVTSERPAVDRIAGDAVPYVRRAFWMAISLVLPAAAGYAATVATVRLLPGPHDAVVRDVEVLKDLDLYRQVGSLEFLERLRTETLPVTAGDGDGR